MEHEPSRFERYVDTIQERGWFKWVTRHIVVPYWIRKDPQRKLPGGPRPAQQPSENLQRMMNLIMPLKDPSPAGRARAALAIAQNVDEIFAGLDNVGTVHFARFLVLGDNICMISVYDGDFSNYIRDFIGTIGSAFDAVLDNVEGGERLIPTNRHVEDFIDWVHAHDLFQAPDVPTDLFLLQDEARGLPPGQPHRVRSLPRALVLQLAANPDLSLGGGYRAYPGYSVAQIREKLGLGW
jgi:hypothetical protein